MDVLMLKSFRLVFALQIILGIVFVFSGITKLIDINAFAEALVNFKLLNDNFITIVKYAIPIIEIILGIGIIFNFNSSFPSFISSLLLSFFTSLIIVKLFEGEEISCGCFGALSSDKLDLLSVFRNVALILIAVIVSTYYEKRKVKPLKKMSNGKDILFENDKYKYLKIIFAINIIFFLTFQTLIFALQNKGLKSRLALLINDHDILQKDEIVKPFGLNTVKNIKIDINYDTNLNKNTLLFLLKPTCSPCKLNLPNWISLYNKIDSSQTRILPIAIAELENTVNYISNNSIPFPVFFTKTDDFLINYKAFLTPQTILIDKNAKVINVWKGILDNNAINEILNNTNKMEKFK
ncbi:MAG: hypothetical protein COW85_04285 [Ignavibacteria bacterium CG22_combo_CG10-13_8_21_14_all_37_15]|nr:MAG: hypothetical protein COW85_04285 [Ignavibacteria bacterium CG22_combo_CG10-13_8_21_14_all_37_15]